MRRRRYLALAGAGLAGAAGCLSRAPGGTDSPTGPGDGGDPTGASPGALEPPATTLALGKPYEHPDGWSLTLDGARVLRIELRRGTHVDPVAFEGGQYVRYRVAADGDANGSDRDGVLPDPARFTVALDGRDATPANRGFWSGHVSGPDGYEDTMVTPVRSTAAERAAIRWQRPEGPVAWRLPSAVREAIADAPAFEVRGLDVPEPVEPGTTFEATLTVANVGDRDGRFLAELGTTAISDTPELRFDVPAGETVEHAAALDPHVPEDAEEVTLVLNWGAGRLERRVAVA